MEVKDEKFYYYGVPKKISFLGRGFAKNQCKEGRKLEQFDILGEDLPKKTRYTQYTQESLEWFLQNH